VPRRAPTLAGWGGLTAPGSERLGEDLARLTEDASLSRGLGRAYGDSALPRSGGAWVAGTRLGDRILGFDPVTGVLHAESGLSLLDLVWTFLPRGWFPPVVPGTQFVTLGGMVAADVHGKNHHVDGTVGRHVEQLRMRLADGRIVNCSRDHLSDLFLSTLGGMGLTGHLLEVWLRLARIPSPWIWQETERVPDLDAFLAGLTDAARAWPFTVGWIDCLAGGRAAGRGILIKGRWATAAEAPAQPPAPLRRLAVPIDFPDFALNRLSIRLFNELYYRRHPRRVRRGIVHPESFFFPLDAIHHWNRIYGRRGFTQHQAVLPEKERPGAVRRLLETLRRHGGAPSFLCVIKDCGAEGEGVLSFPRPGVSVAIDLPCTRSTPALVAALNEVVVAEGGRIYLAKDAFTTREHFAAMEPRLSTFAAARRRWDPERRLGSAQSARLLDEGR
jgi:decaprenylphospho-beta-D-ribofuranose 2-oxidase